MNLFVISTILVIKYSVCCCFTIIPATYIHGASRALENMMRSWFAEDWATQLFNLRWGLLWNFSEIIVSHTGRDYATYGDEYKTRQRLLESL